MQRIMLIGSGGAGKSTLARKMGAILGIEVIHLDALFWKPGWQTTPKEEWVRLQEKLVEQESWIIDGNYSSTVEVRLSHADTIILLDYSRWRCLFQVFKRRIKYHKNVRPDINPGCKEKIDWEFIRWVWNFPTHELPKIREKIEKYAAGKNVISFTKPSDAEKFLQELTARQTSDHKN